MWRKFGDLTAPGDFRKWAFGVARLEALETGRKASRRETVRMLVRSMI